MFQGAARIARKGVFALDLRNQGVRWALGSEGGQKELMHAAMCGRGYENLW